MPIGAAHRQPGRGLHQFPQPSLLRSRTPTTIRSTGSKPRAFTSLPGSPPETTLRDRQPSRVCRLRFCHRQLLGPSHRSRDVTIAQPSFSLDPARFRDDLRSIRFIRRRSTATCPTTGRAHDDRLISRESDRLVVELTDGRAVGDGSRFGSPLRSFEQVLDPDGDRQLIADDMSTRCRPRGCRRARRAGGRPPGLQRAAPRRCPPAPTA